MKSGYKQRPPQQLQTRQPRSLPVISASSEEHLDPWAPKDRESSTPLKPRAVQSKLWIPPAKEPVSQLIEPVLPENPSPYDLWYDMVAYDGSPIIIVPPHYFDIVAGSFKAGLYGFDTESDCMTGELRIIQVYTQAEVYIFPASVLDKLEDNLFIKFLRSKDRIKVGVDIDNDICVIRRHVNRRRKNQSADRHLRNKFTINGIIDIQSIARSVAEPLLSLEKLSAKYVEGFTGNSCVLGSFDPPTTEQYIYAANDAILSLKIYHPLRENRPTKKWLEINEERLFIPLDPPTEKSIKDKISTSSVQPPFRFVEPGARDPSIFQEAARAILAEEESLSSDYESSSPPVEPLVERPKTPEPGVPEPTKKSPKKRKKSGNKAKRVIQTQKNGKEQVDDEIDQILKSINDVKGAPSSPAKASPKTLKTISASVDPELQQKFKERLQAMKKKRGTKQRKSSLEKAKTETKEILDGVQEVERRFEELVNMPVGEFQAKMKSLPPLPPKTEKLQSPPANKTRKFIFFDPDTKETRTMSFDRADGSVKGFSATNEADGELIKVTDRLQEMRIQERNGDIEKNEGIRLETLERLITLNEQLSDDEFYDILAKLILRMRKTPHQSQSYSSIILFLIDILSAKNRYKDVDAILLGNVFVNMALENGYLEFDEQDNLRLPLY